MRCYVAAPIIGINEKQKIQILSIEEKLVNNAGFSLYRPRCLTIPNAWNMPMEQWSRCVFTCDVKEISRADCMVVLDFGRFGSAGTAWECGYAFANNIPTVVVQMPEVEEQSIMMVNGCTRMVSYDEFIKADNIVKFFERDRFKNVKVEVVQN